MLYRYQVLDKEKKLLQGEINADTLQRARLSLLQQGYDVLLLESVKQRFVKMQFGRVGIVPLKEKMLFVKHLSLMIKSGLVLDESIEALYEESKGRMKMILGRLVELVRKGNLLSDGLKLFPYTFNDFFVSMVRIGEQSGMLEKNLINLSVKLKKDHDLRAKVRSALMYPAVVLVAIVGLGITIAVFVLPKLMGFFKSLGVNLPLTTKIFMAVAAFVEQYWYLVSVGIVGLFVAVIVMNRLGRTKRIIHWIVLHLPISRQFSKMSNLANFCRSMNLLLTGGVTIDESLDIMTRALTNNLYQDCVARMLVQISKGTALSDGLKQYPHLFPSIVARMIRVGEMSGNLAETFDYLAEFYEDEMDTLSKNLSTILEPALLVFIGLLVGFMAMAIITPIYSLTGGIRK